MASGFASTPSSEFEELTKSRARTAAQKKKDLAAKYWHHAQELNPDDWNYHRQEWSFTPQEADKNWLEKFQKTEHPYYPKLEMKPGDPKPESQRQ